MSSAARCSNCGNVFMADANFCRHCGHHREQDVQDGEAFRQLCSEIVASATEKLCLHYEREVRQLASELFQCRSQLARVSEMLAQQLVKEKSYREMLDNHSANGGANVQLQRMLAESAELQNQNQVVQRELDNILDVLREPPIRLRGQEAMAPTSPAPRSPAGRQEGAGAGLAAEQSARVPGSSQQQTANPPWQGAALERHKAAAVGQLTQARRWAPPGVQLPATHGGQQSPWSHSPSSAGPPSPGARQEAASLQTPLCGSAAGRAYSPGAALPSSSYGGCCQPSGAAQSFLKGRSLPTAPPPPAWGMSSGQSIAGPVSDVAKRLALH
eukprot:TRINITY_DN22679_c0_g1_i1.p1 TRINITY_DN22679_c0_g1~~TRINITY_DN22679_c0_g1_i1.p1  ORF type:complete len:328 (-),score=54.88 TRINITY_DN22679_c0_g1_i1:16-999(-)